MKIIDITGSIYTGMWNLEPPFPEFKLVEMQQPEWVSTKVYTEIFNGMCGQTGTYLETPAHLLGYKESYPLIDVDISNFIDLKTYVVQLNLEELPEVDGRRVITKEAMVSKFNDSKYKDCRAILISTGWGNYWREKNFISSSPFMKYEAMQYIIGKKPFLLGADSPRWENLEHPEGFFPEFFNANILLLGPCINLDKITREIVLLTVLPIKIENACCCPCRAIVKEID